MKQARNIQQKQRCDLGSKGLDHIFRVLVYRKMITSEHKDVSDMQLNFKKCMYTEVHQSKLLTVISNTMMVLFHSYSHLYRNYLWRCAAHDANNGKQVQELLKEVYMDVSCCLHRYLAVSTVGLLSSPHRHLIWFYVFASLRLFQAKRRSLFLSCTSIHPLEWGSVKR